MKFKVAGIAIAFILLTACSAAAPQQAPAAPDNPYAALPDSARAYLAQVQHFDSLEVLGAAPGRSASDLRVVLSELQMLVPPSDLQQAHDELVQGYEFTLEGREILESRPGNVERAEGKFLTDWGAVHFGQHLDLVSAYVDSLSSTGTP